MKQNVGPAGIALAVCILAVLVFVLYRIFLPAPSGPPPGTSFHRPSYSPPPGAGSPAGHGAPANTKP